MSPNNEPSGCPEMKVLWKLFNTWQQIEDKYQLLRAVLSLSPTNIYCINWTHLLSCTVLGMEPRA